MAAAFLAAGSPGGSLPAEQGGLECILHHHERYDGLGYPDGLQGGAIPLGARIIAVADSFSAMLQSRPYREARSFEQAREELAANAGSQFDPAVAAAFQDNARWMHELLLTARNNCRRGRDAPPMAMMADALRRMHVPCAQARGAASAP